MANIIITNLSRLRTDSTLMDYSSDIVDVKGKNTNDAPVKYLIHYIAGNGGSVDKIIAVTTPEAEPALKALGETLEAFSEEVNIPVPVPVKVIAGNDIYTDTIKDITKEFSSGDRAYIDTTGGFRNSSYILMCVVRILEYSGVRLEKAVYSKQETLSINDITNVYKKYDLINAVDAFTNYGNSHGLKQYFSDSDEPAVNEVVSAMNNFSDQLSLCRTSDLSDTLSEMKASLEKLSNTETSSEDIILFKSLIGTVREKFYMNNDSIEYPDIIRWCLDNRLIQQAVTIYVERIPEYFYKKGYFTVTDEKLKEIKAKKANSHFDISYEMFYNSFMLADKDIPVQKLFRIAAKECHKDYKYDKNNKLHVLFGRLETTSDVNRIFDIMPEGIADRSELEAPLKEFFRLRNIIYSDRKKKNEADYMGKLSYFPELKEMIKNNKNFLANGTAGFIRNIANNEPFCRLISGLEEPEYKNSKLIFIEGLSERKCSEGFSVNESLTNEKMQTILRDLIYTKTFIRNKLNHASDEDVADEEMQKYFSSYGYDTGNETDVNSIRDFMIKAIDELNF